MARIRTVKPEFFRDEDLQDLEAATPGLYVMLAFAGLWCQCDKAGRFEWKPRTLKLDILPFINFDLAETLAVLERGGFVVRYRVNGKDYGYIPTFQKHQRLSGKEAQEAAKYPDPCEACEPPQEAGEQQVGSNGEATGKHPESQEGKGKERNGDREEASAVLPCPHDQIIAAYHEALPANPRVRVWTDARKTALRTRWRENAENYSTVDEGVAWWRTYFDWVSQSYFLTGRTSTPGRRPFLADLEWLVNSSNFVNVLEGKYHE